MNHPEFPYGTHPAFRYSEKQDDTRVECAITGFWHSVVDPEGAAYCAGCQEPVTVPADAQRPQTPLPPSVPLVMGEPDLGEDAVQEKSIPAPRLPCGCVDHENGGLGDYGPECRI